ncbi:MAG: cadherin repeat domain-containing protein [Planctomycetaceae bacterium]|nr:cadherin repeat domain-containing protein [Planctomycetaceae bacterium]
MQAREKKLALILGGAVAVWLVLPAFEGWFLQPVTQRRGLLEVARSQLTQREEQQLELQTARARLRDWQYESLPPNQLTAQREYQEWLMNLATMSGFESATPTLGRRTPRGTTYVQIPVTIEAKATLEQLTRFLYHCERVALVHRIDSLEVSSPQSDGNPQLEVTLTAIGLSLPDAEERRYLFPRTSITSDLSAEATTIEVEPPERFPQVSGFQVKLGQELVMVQKIDGNRWTIERGAEKTVAVAHPAGTAVELFPVDREHQTHTFDDYAALLEHSPFTKPAPLIDYKPEFAPISDPVVMRGTPWETTLTITGWDPSGDTPVFELTDNVPAEMEIDPVTGRLSWTPGNETISQEYDVHVRAQSRINPQQHVSTTLTLTLRDPNLPPVFEDIDRVQAYSGRPLSVRVPAIDPDGSPEELTYSLTGELPEGVTIDAHTGDVSWTPALSLELGDYPITITATDNGEPQQSTDHLLTITLNEDAALHTYFVGYFSEDGQPEAFLYNRATNERTIARPGEQIVVSDIEAEISEISSNQIELTIGSRTFRLPLGNSLRQLLPVGEAIAPASPTAE